MHNKRHLQFRRTRVATQCTSAFYNRLPTPNWLCSVKNANPHPSHPQKTPKPLFSILYIARSSGDPVAWTSPSKVFSLLPLGLRGGNREAAESPTSSHAILEEKRPMSPILSLPQPRFLKSASFFQKRTPGAVITSTHNILANFPPPRTSWGTAQRRSPRSPL